MKWLLILQRTLAVAVLEDDFALTREDPDSEGEQRFVTLGMSIFAHLLVVVYTYREPDVIRIIRSIVEKAGGGNYQTLINDALIEYIQQRGYPGSPLPHSLHSSL